MVAAVSRVVPVAYAEIVASIASKSAGPGTRANIDEFTETTSEAIVAVGGARRGKAIIILNPAEPPLIMRDTVFCLVDAPDPAVHDEIRQSIEKMVGDVSAYVPRLPAQAGSPDHRDPGRPARRDVARRRQSPPPTRCRCSSRSRARHTTCLRTPAISTS